MIFHVYNGRSAQDLSYMFLSLQDILSVTSLPLKICFEIFNKSDQNI